MTSSQNVSTFAIQTLLLGEGDGWQTLGYNLDGLVTTSTSSNGCVLLSGASALNQSDGNDGIDNAWGHVVVPIIQSAFAAPTPSSTVSQIIDSGGWTLQIQVTGLSDDPHETAIGLGAQLFVGGSLGSAPAFDQTTSWPVLPSSLTGTTVAGGALVRFSNVYVEDGTLVAEGSPLPLVVPLMLTGSLPLPLQIHDATLTFVHATPTSAAQGIIAGVLDPQEFVDAFRAVAGKISLSLCGVSFDGIAQAIEQAQDILQDGTNGVGVSCNAISVGIGFTASLISNPTTVGVDPTTPTDPCN